MQRGITKPAARTIRFSVLVFAASVLAVGALTACGGGFSGGTNDGGGYSGGGGSSSGTNDGAGASSVTGTVTWPDGTPAAGASVYFYDYEPQISLDTGGWSNGTYQVQQLPADGSYSLSGCPCNDLTAYIYLPGQPGGDPNNGGQDCWIIMGDDSGNYSGDPANPGDVINWQALDMPCDSTWYASDQSAVQSTASLLAQQSVGYAGTWQAAAARASGGGSGS
jgi:hypothetical protein